MTDNSLAVHDLVLREREGGYARGRENFELILRAALQILIDGGYKALTMRRVAAASGLQYGNLSYYFRTREDLVRELLDAIINSYEIEFETIVHDSDIAPEQRLERLCALVLEDIRTLKTTKLFPELWALSNHDAYVEERLRDFYRRGRVWLSQVISELRPDLSEEKVDLLSLFISGSMEGMTIFAGSGKLYESKMDEIYDISVKSFSLLIKKYKD
jgi:AcrR family transcriptional regulator